MRIEKFGIYLADLNPRRGTEPGKIRPVVVIQTDLLNGIHASTIVCPVTSQIVKEAKILRIHLSKSESGLSTDSDVLVDQIRAIDNRRFRSQIGKLHLKHQELLLQNLKRIIFE